MPVTTLRMRSYLWVSVQVRWQAFRHFQITYTVETEEGVPVRVYIVSPDQFTAFQNGQPFQSYGPQDAASRFQGAWRLPEPGQWFVVIQNNSDNPTALYYNIAG